MDEPTLVYPVASLYQNPWRDSLTDDVVLQILQRAGNELYKELVRKHRAYETPINRDSFAIIMLDPTRPRWQLTLTQRLFAIIEIGPGAEMYVPFAADKADVQDRQGVDMGYLVENASHCLGNDDFAYPGSAMYLRATGACSGLPPEQDAPMALMGLKLVMDDVTAQRKLWLDARRTNGGVKRWFNKDDEVPAEYEAIFDLKPILSTAA